MKMKWKVHPAPTGRYRSFEHRGWPRLLYEDGHLAALITCEDDYSLARARTGNHASLSVLLYDYSLGVQNRKVRKLVHRFSNLDHAKRSAEATLKQYPQFAASKRRGVPNESSGQ